MFEVTVLSESQPDVAKKIVNKAQVPKELQLEVASESKPEVGQLVKIMVPLEVTDVSNRNKWIVTKHHVEEKDWFTLKNEAYGYFLTCRTKDPVKYPDGIVSYEIPGIHLRPRQIFTIFDPYPRLCK